MHGLFYAACCLNTEREGLKKVYKYVKQGEVDKVLVTYRDRLTRFVTRTLSTSPCLTYL